MDIKGSNSQNSTDSLEQLKQLKANCFAPKANSDETDTDIENQAADSADSDAFSSLKLKVAQAKQAGRAEYISELKESIASGEYNISANDLASALIADGIGELLVS